MMTNDTKIIGGLIITITVVLSITAFCLKKASNKLNKEDLERISKLSMVSEEGYDGEEIDKSFRLSTILEEDYNNLNTNRISIAIIVETDGKISGNL
jgi:hypothetical protein